MRRLDPNVTLALAAAWIVVVELATRSQSRYGVECVVTGLALVVAWKRRDALAPSALIGLAAALPAALAVVHLARHAGGDIDVGQVYPTQGHSLLSGVYPHSEYPPGAVLLFAFEARVRSPRTVNPFVMALCGAAIAWSLCAVRTAEARWLAAVVAIWPVDAFFWEYKFDALPTALLLVGAVAALRRRWVLAGALLGVGAAVKWTPAVAAAILVLWLISSRSPRDALRHAAGFAAAFASLVVPFLVWSPSAVLASVTRQAPRSITPESLWYLPLHAVGRASEPGAVYSAAAVPHWANTVAVALQVLVLVVLACSVALRLSLPPAAVAAALAGPALFLLLNKVFSAQYMLTVIAACALGAALVGPVRAVGVLLMVATAANVLVYPIGRFWLPASTVLFVSSLAAVGLVVYEALRSPRYPRVQ